MTISFDSLEKGTEIAARQIPVTRADLVAYAGASGDFNPIHLDAEYAKKSFFGTRLVQGMFVASLIGAVAAPLCGSASINMGQSFTFPAPARLGDTLTATIEVMEKVEEKHDLILKLTVTRQDGVVVLDGTNTVKIMDKKKKS